MNGFEGANANPHHYRDMFFPDYAQKNQAPDKALPTTAVVNGFDASMFDLIGDFEPFLDQVPVPQLMSDDVFRTRSSESSSIPIPYVSDK